MIFRDARGVVIDCNRAAETILGRSRDVLLGTTTPQFEGRAINLDGTPLDFDHTWVTKALASNRPGAIVAGFEVPDRICRWLSIRFWPAVVEGEVVGLMTAFEDVTRKVNGDRFLNLLNRVKDTARPRRQRRRAAPEDLRRRSSKRVTTRSPGSASPRTKAASTFCAHPVRPTISCSGMVSWWGSSDAGTRTDGYGAAHEYDPSRERSSDPAALWPLA